MQLSIITINFNNIDGLRQTIDSVLSQTWHDFEWIVIDGGSSDGSKDLLLQHQSHFSYWCSEPDTGIYNAMNKGICKAHGDYCLFLNSGDYLNNERVLSDAFSHVKGQDIALFDMIADKEGPLEYLCRVDVFPIAVDCLILGALPHQAALIRRQLFSTIGLYDENLRIVSDWKFFFQAIVFHQVSCSYNAMIFAKVQPGGLSTTQIEYREHERQQVLSELLPPQIIRDYSLVHSLAYVYRASWLCRRLYALLFRFADLTHRLRK